MIRVGKIDQASLRCARKAATRINRIATSEVSFAFGDAGAHVLAHAKGAIRDKLDL